MDEEKSIEELLKNTEIKSGLHSWFFSQIQNSDDVVFRECKSICGDDLNAYRRILIDRYKASGYKDRALRQIFRVEQLLDSQKQLQDYFSENYGKQDVTLMYLFERFGVPGHPRRWYKVLICFTENRKELDTRDWELFYFKHMESKDAELVELAYEQDEICFGDIEKMLQYYVKVLNDEKMVYLDRGTMKDSIERLEKIRDLDKMLAESKSQIRGIPINSYQLVNMFEPVRNKGGPPSP